MHSSSLLSTGPQCVAAASLLADDLNPGCAADCAGLLNFLGIDPLRDSDLVWASLPESTTDAAEPPLHDCKILTYNVLPAVCSQPWIELHP